MQKRGKYVETHIAPHLAIVRWAKRIPSITRDFDRLTPERRALWEQAAAGFSADDVAASREALCRAASRIAQDLERGPWLAGLDHSSRIRRSSPTLSSSRRWPSSSSRAVEEWRSRVARRPAVRSAAGATELVLTMAPERGRWG